MDEVIFEEFKGTGNMEVSLDRGLVDRRIFPSINVELSGTRKEELLYHPDEYSRVVLLRRALTGVPPVEAMDLLLGKLKKHKSNIEFLLGMSVP
jgi:transcription termination factor Rho